MKEPPSTDHDHGSLALRPIGVIRTSMRLKFDAPPQPDQSDPSRSVIELNPHLDFEQALQDLDGFERIWLVWWFHRNDSWRPMVLPPRGEGKKRGVFATRSPHRPNPIGITSVELIAVRGRTLEVGANDLVDGTPILDIKPYLPAADAFPAARAGWVDEVEKSYEEPPRFSVTLSTLAGEQAEWLKARGVDFLERTTELLARDPSPHRTRRIKQYDERLYQMGCGAWRSYFTLSETLVTLERFSPGYPERVLLSPEYEQIPDRDLQMEFGRIWPFD